MRMVTIGVLSVNVVLAMVIASLFSSSMAIAQGNCGVRCVGLLCIRNLNNNTYHLLVQPCVQTDQVFANFNSDIGDFGLCPDELCEAIWIECEQGTPVCSSSGQNAGRAVGCQTPIGDEIPSISWKRCKECTS